MITQRLRNDFVTTRSQDAIVDNGNITVSLCNHASVAEPLINLSLKILMYYFFRSYDPLLPLFGHAAILVGLILPLCMYVCIYLVITLVNTPLVG